MVSPPRLTFVTVCKGRLAHLKQSLPQLLRQTGSRVIVVDVDCPDGTAAWLATNHPQVTVCRSMDKGNFNVCRARNEGLALVETPWVGFVDADVILATNFSIQLFDRLAANQFYTFQNTAEKFGISGTVVAETQAVRSFGGYDEAILDYGGEDYDLYDNLGRRGHTNVQLDDSIVDQVLQHSKELRTQHYDIKDTRFSMTVNGLYRILKKHVRNTEPNIDLNIPQKQRIYAEALRAVQLAHESRQKFVELEIPLPRDPIMYEPYATLHQKLKLKLELKF